MFAALLAEEFLSGKIDITEEVDTWSLPIHKVLVETQDGGLE